MAIPLPKDPLDDLVARFVSATNEFLALNADVDPAPRHDTGNPLLDLMHNWDEFKRHIQRSREALIGAEPERRARLDVIVDVGCEIKALTEDYHITNPVDGVVMRATDERAEFGNIIPVMAKATSFSAVMSLIGELLGFGTRTIARRKEIADLLNDLQAYYLLRPHPPESA
jgi:hypothetical protein